MYCNSIVGHQSTAPAGAECASDTGAATACTFTEGVHILPPARLLRILRQNPPWVCATVADISAIRVSTRAGVAQFTARIQHTYGMNTLTQHVKFPKIVLLSSSGQHWRREHAASPGVQKYGPVATSAVGRAHAFAGVRVRSHANLRADIFVKADLMFPELMCLRWCPSLLDLMLRGICAPSDQASCAVAVQAPHTR